MLRLGRVHFVRKGLGRYSSSNPLVHWETVPQFDAIRAEHVAPAVEQILSECSERFSRLEESTPSTWDELVPDLERIHDRLGKTWGVVSHLHLVKNSPELREAYETAAPLVSRFSTRMAQSKPLFDAFTALREGGEWDTFTSGQQRVVETAMKEMELEGVGLPPAERDTVSTLNERLALLSSSFGNNVLDSTKSLQLVLTGEDEIAGLPPSLLALAADAAREKGHDLATPEEGPWIITFDAPSIDPFLKHSKRRDLRERAYRDYATRASSGSVDNTPLLKEILQLRSEKAHILGFDNYAQVSLSSKMAGTAGAVDELMERLRAAAHRHAEREMDELLTFARERGHEGELEAWDVSYWANELKEASFSLDSDALRSYFPLPKVLDGMFALVGKLFDIDVVKEDDVPRWHDDVQFYRVHNRATGRPIAAFYLDPYSRPEKRGGAWMDSLVGRSRVLGSGGEAREPIAYIVCNQTKPLGGSPSLMTFTDVETLFHEFGHALQHLLTTVEEGAVAGISGVEWDAVELPSQFMENWCYHSPTLQVFARHHETGEPLPSSSVDSLIAARSFRAGSFTLRQVMFALTDLRLHDTPAPVADPHALFSTLEGDITPMMPVLPEARFLCSFFHIFAGGYAAGYYSYKWAEVLSADAFSAFEEVLEDEEAVVDMGLRFRDTVLALGGSEHPSKVFRRFRGRDPTPEALLRHQNLS